MERKTYRLPPTFWYDHHVERECSRTAVVLRERKTYVEVSLDAEAYRDLYSDCEYYVHTGRGGHFDPGMGGIVASARATLKRLQADPLDDYDGLQLDALVAQADAEHKQPPKQRYVFENPGDGYPLTVSAIARTEAQARRMNKADLPWTADWPIRSIDPVKE